MLIFVIAIKYFDSNKNCTRERKNTMIILYGAIHEYWRFGYGNRKWLAFVHSCFNVGSTFTVVPVSTNDVCWTRDLSWPIRHGVVIELISKKFHIQWPAASYFLTEGWARIVFRMKNESVLLFIRSFFPKRNTEVARRHTPTVFCHLEEFSLRNTFHREYWRKRH